MAFFPILSNTTLGLSSVDHNLLELMQLYRARRGQVLWFLRLPAAMPYFLGGLRIAGGLSADAMAAVGTPWLTVVFRRP